MWEIEIWREQAKMVVMKRPKMKFEQVEVKFEKEEVKIEKEIEEEEKFEKEIVKIEQEQQQQPKDQMMRGDQSHLHRE